MQLSHSIKSVYGNEFDSNQYLKRFFDSKALLPEPNVTNYLTHLKIDFSEYALLSFYPTINRLDVDITDYLTGLSKVFNLQIRDIHQLIIKLKSCLRSALNYQKTNNITQHINILTLLLALVEFDFNKNEFYQRNVDNPCIPESMNTSQDFSKKIEISIETSFLYENSFEDYGMTINTQSRMSQKDFLQLHYSIEENNIKLREWSYQIFTNIDENETWLWDDYKKMAELAGKLT